MCGFKVCAIGQFASIWLWVPREMALSELYFAFSERRILGNFLELVNGAEKILLTIFRWMYNCETLSRWFGLKYRQKAANHFSTDRASNYMQWAISENGCVIVSSVCVCVSEMHKVNICCDGKKSCWSRSIHTHTWLNRLHFKGHNSNDFFSLSFHFDWRAAVAHSWVISTEKSHNRHNATLRNCWLFTWIYTAMRNVFSVCVNVQKGTDSPGASVLLFIGYSIWRFPRKFHWKAHKIKTTTRTTDKRNTTTWNETGDAKMTEREMARRQESECDSRTTQSGIVMHTILIIYCNITCTKRREWHEVAAVSDIKFWLQQLYGNKLKNECSGRVRDREDEGGRMAELKKLKIKNNAIIKISNSTHTKWKEEINLPTKPNIFRNGMKRV